MKVRIPDKIRVSSFVFPIKMVQGLARHHGLLGQALTDDGFIQIDNDLIPQVRDQALLHEIIHAISMIYSCKLEEENIDRLAHGLADVLKNSFGIEFEWG